MIYDTYLIKNNKNIKKLSLMYIDEKICDCCDELTKCAVINTLSNQINIICKSCLDKISFEFYSEKEKRDIMINKILND